MEHPRYALFYYPTRLSIDIHLYDAAGLGSVTGMLKSLTGQKELTAADLEKPLIELKDQVCWHLVSFHIFWGKLACWYVCASVFVWNEYVCTILQARRKKCGDGDRDELV